MFCAFVLLSALVFLGCTTDQDVASSKKESIPVAQATGIEGQDVAASTEPGMPKAITPNDGGADAVIVLVADNVTTLDPYQMVGIHPDGSVASHLWDTLTLLNDDLQIEPSLSESWRLVNNFTWELKLRQGINFHNGEPLNAEAVRFSIERAESLPDSLETFTIDIDLEEVEIINDYTIRVTTGQPIANLPYHLSFLEILPPVYYSETDPAQLAVMPVGSGPYQLSEAWHRGQPLVLEANPNYWKDPPAIPRIIFKTVPSDDERLAALRRKEADLVTDLPPIALDQWNFTDSTLETIESNQRMFIGIHMEEGSPLADQRVRQALNYGVNVEQLVDDWLEGYGERYGSWVTPPSANPGLVPWPYDPDLARDLLADAGYTDGFTTTLKAPAGFYHNDIEIAQAVAQQLGEIGITIEIKPYDNWDIYVHELLVSPDDTASLYFLGLNSRGNGLEDTKNLSPDFAFNLTGWQNESFAGLLSKANNTFNKSFKTELLNEAQSVAYQDAPWIWLWKQYDFYGVSPNLEWTPRRDGLVYLYKPMVPLAKNDE